MNSPYSIQIGRPRFTVPFLRIFSYNDHMMEKKFLLFSDTHGRNAVVRFVLQEFGPFDGAVFCGDGEGLENELMSMPGCPAELFMAAGNCDYYTTLREDAVFPLGKHKVFLTHGHKYALRRNLSTLASFAEKNGCDLCFFGHTHLPCDETVNGVRLINPGSLGLPRQEPAFPTFVILTLKEDGTVLPELKKLRGEVKNL